MSANDGNEKRNYSAWEKHQISQLLYFRSLTMRQKMQAVEELGEIARRLAKIKQVPSARDEVVDSD